MTLYGSWIGLACTVAVLLGAGCTSGVTLRVDRMNEIGQVSGPLPGAHVYAIAISQSDIPLPVTVEALERVFLAQPPSAATDARGEVTLDFYPKTRYLVQVSPPPFGDLADHRPWVWTLDPASGDLERHRLSEQDSGLDAVRLSVER